MLSHVLAFMGDLAVQIELSSTVLFYRMFWLIWEIVYHKAVQIADY